MTRAARGLRELVTDPGRARSVGGGGGALSVVLLAGLAWRAWAQGGTRLDTPMGQALAGSAVAALASGAKATSANSKASVFIGWS